MVSGDEVPQKLKQNAKLAIMSEIIGLTHAKDGDVYSL